eukprot:TRINITY_DN16380_c0_g1_i2.p3 TRINITY_DN16380_c0_g1~~TRINITY_DN16380_c0_g1_i2.p3  ORF type:complete len:267 (+),score=110.36 TRINITY_DN16380_c0_g1_i2:123-803(+)
MGGGGGGPASPGSPRGGRRPPADGGSPRAARASGKQSYPICGGEKLNITREDVEQAFKFFDTDDRGTLRMKDLKAKLDVFFPGFTSKEYKLLISEANFTVDTLWGLISDNIGNVSTDPCIDAFKVYDPKGTGFVDPEVLRNVMQQMGYGPMTEDEAVALIKTADWDGDGKIGLSDFRRMLGFFPDFRREAREEQPKFEMNVVVAGDAEEQPDAFSGLRVQTNASED